MNIAINNKGGDCWTQIVIDVNMAIFKRRRQSISEPRGSKGPIGGEHRVIEGATGVRGAIGEAIEAYRSQKEQTEQME